jgi:hypothetical protein
MEQADLIPEVTMKFAEKFKVLAEVKIKDTYNDQTKDDPTVIVITPLGVEELPMHNKQEKIELQENDTDGNSVACLTAPPSMVKISYMVTPHFKTYNDSLRILGSIVKIVKDDNLIPVDGFDWLTNNNQPICIEPIEDMNIEKQMQIFSMLRMDYRPSLFYFLIVGVNSGIKDSYKRVKERKFDMHDSAGKK